MPDKTARGRFVWHELMAPSAAQAHQFYAKVVGWKTQAFEHDPNYHMFAAASGPLGGTVERAEGAASWLPFIGTTDIETTLGDALQLGGRVLTKVSSVPGGGGQWAILQDPQGATFAAYQSSGPQTPEKPPKRGEFSWHELATSDYKAAFEFYSKLFGWEVSEEVDMGPLGMYFMFGRNGAPLGGMFKMPAEMPGGPSWCGYIRVKDVNKAVSMAKGAGATLINGPMEVPGGDWIAQLIDPQGAMFAVHTLKVDLAPSEAAAAPAAPEQVSLDFSVPPQKAQPTSAASKPQSVAAKKSGATAKAKSAPKVAKRPVKKASQKSRASKKVAPKKTSTKKTSTKKKAASKRVSKSPARKVAKKTVRKPLKTRAKVRRPK